MHRIGVYVRGWEQGGGSYQYWLAFVKALSMLDREQYEVQVYSRSSKWLELAGQLGLQQIKWKPARNKAAVYCERAYRRFHSRILLDLCKILNSDLRSMKKYAPDLWITQIVDGTSDLMEVPSMIPIFDLMHRYESRFAEVASEYDSRENMYRHQCEFAEIILADSEVGRKHILESYGEYRSELAEHIEILPFIPPDYIFHYRQVDNLSYELFDKYIFYPAQFWTHKNHKNLIDALALLKEDGVEVNLVLVGSEQNNRANIERLIKEKKLLENVKILGYVSNSEMVYLYQHARALVMPTFFGPTNIPQLEAFELGCPVATSNIYGIPEQVGDAALLFSPESVKEIAECIRRLWEDDELCESLIRKGQERARQWGEREFAERVCEIIDRYFAKKRKK